MSAEVPSVPASSRSFELLREGLELLYTWRVLPPFRARVVSQYGEDEPAREFDLIAEPRLLRYQLTELESGSVSSFDGTTSELIIGDEPEIFRPDLVGFEPLEVRLAFPANLGIWGAPLGTYRVVGGREVSAGQFADDPNVRPGDIEILLAYAMAPELSGSLVVSRRERTAVRLDTPTLSIWYRSIEPL